MLDNYLIVSKEALPEVFGKVMKVKKMMNHGDFTQVSEACKAVGISRSAYYKYKDHVFETNTNGTERKAVISFILSHQKGILSEVINFLTSNKCNILTINQNIPIHSKASVSISLDISEIICSMDELIAQLSNVYGVSKANLISLE